LYQPASRIRHHKAASINSRYFRNFLYYRNRLLLLKKWGAALANHEPWLVEDSPAIERALARAEILADQCRPKDDMITKHPVRTTTFNAAEQDSRCVKKGRELQIAYIVHLMRMVLAKVRDYFRKRFGRIARL